MADYSHPFDAVLVIAFGGPNGPDDVRPFLANVLRGRRVPPSRLEEVAGHYDLFDGVSPITELTRRQAGGLAERLAKAGERLPVYVGMRNWHPFLHETLLDMSQAGVRHAIGFIMAPHASYSSCEQYRRNVDEARQRLADRGAADVRVTYVGPWHAHPGFVETVADHIRAAAGGLPDELRSRARVVFTAHSIPQEMARRSRYEAELGESCAAVAHVLERSDWALVYQSRSGRPGDPWLEPDVCNYLRDARAGGLAAAILSPIGFVADHVEVLYDLDAEAVGLCREIDLPVVRAAAVNDAPRFLAGMADVVRATIERHAHRVPPPLLPRWSDAARTDDRRRRAPPVMTREPADSLSVDGRLRTMFVERADQLARDRRGFLAFDLVAFHHVGQLPVPQQADRRRRRRIAGKQCPRPFCRFDIRASEHGRHDVWSRRVLEGERDAWPGLACRASTDGIDDNHHGAVGVSDDRINGVGRSQFLHTQPRQFLAHRRDHELGITHDVALLSTSTLTLAWPLNEAPARTSDMLTPCRPNRHH
ncbi:MAG TPA: ferrochelatase [Vicinamibacterales bacterium]|jgi:ferrochelatase|nr:ferrochelatase [Vicinamibacterales bacterium]HJO37227.1 ferrochelatase [Vicinamibacterales bacterium]